MRQSVLAFLTSFVALVCGAQAGFAADLPAARCADLAHRTFGHTEILSATLRPAGAFSLPKPLAISFALPSFCRVKAASHPSSDSDIRFEVWLPLDGKWNGKLVAVGNGGYLGIVPTWEMAPALRSGYAAVGGDTGHEGDGLAWGIGHPEKIRDWGDRSIHAITIGAKAITAAFEGKPPQEAYFNGCSTGGHQALTEAQRYPDDFNGIIAGAPGNNRTHLNVAFLWIGVQNRLAPPDGRLSKTNLKMIGETVLKRCDAKDGLKDGIVADPRRCRLPPKTFLCRNTHVKGCLNPAQARTLARLYQGPRDPRSGKQIYPPFTRGSEGGWNYLLNSPKVYRAGFWSDWVFDNPNWSWKTFNWDKNVAFADSKLASIINANDPDLTRFRDHGGKLIMYQGWIDPVVSALDTLRYYTAVTKTMGGRQTTRRFARLFMVPDMAHCGTFGGGDFNMVPIDDPEHRNVLSMLDRWVTEARAPRRLIVEQRKGFTGPVTRTRVACAWPKVAEWRGKGSLDKARNFVCKRQN